MHVGMYIAMRCPRFQMRYESMKRGDGLLYWARVAKFEYLPKLDIRIAAVFAMSLKIEMTIYTQEGKFYLLPIP